MSRLLSRWGRRFRLPVLLLTAVAASAAPPETDPLLAAMRDELARSREIRMPGLEAPYYLEYTINGGRTFAVSATLGGIVGLRREQFRIPEIKIRVGDYSLDNTNYVGSGLGGGSRYTGRFPLEDAYPLLRRYLWLETDSAYKAALDAFSHKRAALRNLAAGERLDDFAHAPPLKRIEELRAQSLDEDAWMARVRALSAVFAGFPGIKNSSVELEAIESSHYYVTSEGAEIRLPERVIFLRARAQAQAPDGAALRDAEVFHALTFDGLPPEPAMAAAMAALAKRATALAGAPRGENYSGPVLFEGAAAAQLFAELLGRNLTINRRPVIEPGRPASFPAGELAARQGARILPEWMDVVDDPTLAQWNGRPLFGHYPVDREGVPPAPVSVVEKGVLKNYLMTRQPVRGHSGSNGHARLPGAYGANLAAIGNLIVRAAEAAPVAELKRKLLEICEARNLPYGLIVRKMDFPSSAALEEIRRLLAESRQSGQPVSIPLLVYKVTPDGREQLVRGLAFRGLNARSLKDILAAGDNPQVFEFLNNNAPFALMGAAGYAAESAVIAPSVLIDNLELHPMEDAQPRLPVVPPPS